MSLSCFSESSVATSHVLRLREDIEEEDEEEEEDVSSDPEEEDEDEGEETEEEEEEDSHSVPPRIANAADNADQARAPAHTACTTPGHTHFHPLALAQVCDYPMCAFMGEGCPNRRKLSYVIKILCRVGECWIWQPLVESLHLEPQIAGKLESARSRFQPKHSSKSKFQWKTQTSK